MAGYQGANKELRDLPSLLKLELRQVGCKQDTTFPMGSMNRVRESAHEEAGTAPSCLKLQGTAKLSFLGSMANFFSFQKLF